MRRSLITALLLLVALVPVGMVVAGDSTDPGPPAWSGAGGGADDEGIPADFGVSGPDGAPVVCANGKELRVKKEKLLAPPPHPARRIAGSSEGHVWRCGSGSNPHLNARLVPESEDPLAPENRGSG